MKALVTLCGAAAITLAMAGCSSSADTHAADIKAINNTEAQWNQDYAAKDLNKISAHYGEDAVLMITGMTPVSGKDAIRNSLQQMVADPAMTLSFKASKVEVAKSGDIGYTQGSYQLTMTDPVSHKIVNDHGSYVTTYRKQTDGTWKAVTDIVTSEVPPPAPPAETHHAGKKHASAKHANQKKHHAK